MSDAIKNALSSVDEGKGIVKVYWKDVRERVEKVDPEFAYMVDKLDPDQKFPLYLTYFAYGDLIGDKKGLFLPTRESGVFKFSDSGVPSDLITDLGYGRNSLPMGMLLERTLEWFIDLKADNMKNSRTIPWVMYRPGTFFPVLRVLRKKDQRAYAPNNVLLTASGARSVFMLPHIGRVLNHSFLQRDYNIHLPAPKFLYEHWSLFKAILNSQKIKSDWRSCILYFSEKWVKKLHHDIAWSRLKVYLHETTWQRYQYERNKTYYDLTFADIQKRCRRPDPYLADMASHIFAVALGASPGYVPAVNEDYLPLQALQEVYVNSYKLDQYWPSIMQPTHFTFETDQYPIYYSLQTQATSMFSPKSRNEASILAQMRAMWDILKVYQEELVKEETWCSDTILGQVARVVDFNLYHNKPDAHDVIQLSTQIPDHDPRFPPKDKKLKLPQATFEYGGPFARGCVSISSIRDK